MNELIYASQFEWRVCTRARECLNLAAEISSWAIAHRAGARGVVSGEALVDRGPEDCPKESGLMTKPKLTVVSDEIKIERGIPMPAKRNGLPKYPWRELEVGDSFFFATDSTPEIANLRALASTSSRRMDRKFMARKVDGGIRIWRVE